MNDSCEQFDRRLAHGVLEGDEEARWLEHLAECAVCSEQAPADVLLRGALGDPAPKLSAEFDRRLRRRLEQRVAGAPAPTRRPGRLRPSGWWLLVAYGTVAAAASVVIVARLPWQSFTPSPVLGITLGALALLSPLVLLDRIGIVRPPV